MSKSRSTITSHTDAQVDRPGPVGDQMSVRGRFEVTCYGPDGKLKWTEVIENLVVTVGKNDILNKYLDIATVAGIFMGLISSVSYTTGVVAGDTMASHGGWTEAGLANAPTYSQGTRPAPAFGAAAAGVKATSAAVVFSITSSGTVKGSFLTTVATKDGTTGTLVAGGVFTGGDKVVSNLDTLNATYSLTLT